MEAVFPEGMKGCPNLVHSSAQSLWLTSKRCGLSLDTHGGQAEVSEQTHPHTSPANYETLHWTHSPVPLTICQLPPAALTPTACYSAV